jgi:hypothetical protein
MEADKLGGYTVKEWRQMIEGGGRYIRRSSWVRQAKYIRKKNAQNKEARKESVTEELYYVRNEGFWATLYCGGQKAVTAIPI